jgi:ketosteroid isomerase-like protein
MIEGVEMRKILFVLAAGAVGACETMPEFLTQPTGAATTSSTAASTATTTPAASYRQPADQQLLELERRLSAAAQERGLGGALGSVIDPADGFVVRAGATYQGAEAVERGLAPAAGAGPVYWQPDRVHVAQAGDMGMTSGRYVQVMTGSEAVQGRYVAVWRRDGAGEWKLLSESRIADPPRASVRRR